MKAMIFAAGIGSRLKPWTDYHPKALAPVDNKPVLQHVIDNIRKQLDPDCFVVNVHHFHDQVSRWIEDYSQKNNDRIFISDESDKLLDTGGGLLKASTLFKSDNEIYIQNCDILTDIDLTEMLKFHRENKNDVTLLCNKRKTSRSLIFDKNDLLKGWTNKYTGEVLPKGLTLYPDDKTLAFNGIHIVSNRIFSNLEQYSRMIKSDRLPIIDFYLWVSDKLKIRSYESVENYKWIDIGKTENLLEADKMFRQR